MTPPRALVVIHSGLATRADKPDKPNPEPDLDPDPDLNPDPDPDPDPDPGLDLDLAGDHNQLWIWINPICVSMPYPPVRWGGSLLPPAPAKHLYTHIPRDDRI